MLSREWQDHIAYARTLREQPDQNQVWNELIPHLQDEGFMQLGPYMFAKAYLTDERQQVRVEFSAGANKAVYTVMTVEGENFRPLIMRELPIGSLIQLVKSLEAKEE